MISKARASPVDAFLTRLKASMSLTFIRFSVLLMGSLTVIFFSISSRRTVVIDFVPLGFPFGFPLCPGLNGVKFSTLPATDSPLIRHVLPLKGHGYC